VRSAALDQRISEEQSDNSFMAGFDDPESIVNRIMSILKNGPGEAPAGARIDVKARIG
jgi:hypothetical protein